MPGAVPPAFDEPVDFVSPLPPSPGFAFFEGEAEGFAADFGVPDFFGDAFGDFEALGFGVALGFGLGVDSGVGFGVVLGVGSGVGVGVGVSLGVGFGVAVGVGVGRTISLGAVGLSGSFSAFPGGWGAAGFSSSGVSGGADSP